MVGNWKKVSLEDIAAKTDRPFAMGPFGSNIKAENYQQTGVPIIRGGNLNDAGGPPFNFEDFVYLSEEKADELKSSNTFPGDIVFVAQGSVGRVGIVPFDKPVKRYVLSQNLMKASVDSKHADPLYVFYYFRSLEGQHEIFSRVNPTGVPCISQPLTSLKSFQIEIPEDIEEQRAIAHILGTLDDKIELNRKMNQTLEAMARAIFKSWFVDFDPVRAKAEGRDPGLLPDLAALFPDSFEDSELGEIPKGWRICGIGQCLALLKDGSHNPPQRVQEGIPFIAGATDVKHFSVDFSKCTYITADDYNAIHRKWNVQADDVLLTIVGTVGNVALVSQKDLPFSLQRSIAVLRPGPMLSSSFLYCLLLSPGFRAAVDSRLNPTAQPGIYLGSLAAIPICLPPRQLVTAFDSVASTVFVKMQKIVLESRTLVTLRDTLLPKLLSGEIRVKDAEKVVEVGS